LRRTRPELLGALLKVAVPAGSFLRWGRNVGQQNKAYWVITNAASSANQSVPALDATGAQTPISELSLAPERTDRRAEQSFPRSEQMFELHGGAGRLASARLADGRRKRPFQFLTPRLCRLAGLDIANWGLAKNRLYSR